MLPKYKSTETESRSLVAGDWGEGRRGSDCLIGQGLLWGDENVLELDRSGRCTAL